MTRREQLVEVFEDTQRLQFTVVIMKQRIILLSQVCLAPTDRPVYQYESQEIELCATFWTSIPFLGINLRYL